jgi:predicted ATPase/DNA-binding SARP family transcriptional activator
VLSESGLVAGTSLGGRRIQLVLVALATAPGGLTPAALAERIWPQPPSTWAAALRGTILGLRSALDPIGLGGQELVQTTATGWMLAPGTDVDIVTATTAVAKAERQLSEGKAGSARDAIRELLAVESTTLFPGEDADWIVELRSRIAALDERVLAVEADAALRLGRVAAAAHAARRLIFANPLDERAHRFLIRALAASGDRAGAIHAFEECRSVLAEQLGMDPAAETTGVYLEILRSGSSGGAGNLPAPPRNGFFGRQEELSLVAAALREPGVVSVLGRGGVGKTRLALHAAQASVVDAPANRFWVPLGDLRSPGLVAVTIARSIGAADAADPLASIVSVLAPLGSALIVLDGCEELVDGVSEVLSALLPSTPGLRVLATSRRPLDVAGERKVEIDPLDVPSPGDAHLGRSAGVQLLADRMALRGVTLLLNADNARAVQELCSRCGGVPLALELAAAQLGSMAVADLLDGLPTAARGAEGVIDSLLQQSYDSLGDDEATLFRALGAVEGSLPLALVASLAPESPTRGRIARILAELSDRGLVEIDRAGPRWSYRQDDQVRTFARAHLASNEGETWFLERLVESARAVLPDDARTPPSTFRESVDEAWDGFRTLFEATSSGVISRESGLELAFRLHRYWAVAGIAEGRFWLERLLDGGQETPWTAFATFAAGYLAYWAGDTGPARTQLEEAARLLRGVDDGFAARSLVFAAGIADDQDRPEEALADIRVAVELAESTGDANVIGSATMGIASILAERGDREAVSHAQRALEIARDQGSPDQLLATLATGAMVAWQVGALDEAARAIADGGTLLDGDPRISRMILATASAGVALAEGRLEDAAHMAELSVSDGEELGVERELPLAHVVRARVALERGRTGQAARSALDAVASARRLGYPYPLAICLETAALVLGVSGDTVGLIATAAELRRVGARPAPSGLGLSVPPGVQPEPLEDAVARAVSALTELLDEEHGEHHHEGVPG